jgi:2-methylcitrate dehydratase PrpD
LKAELPPPGASVAERIARLVQTCDPAADPQARAVARRLMLDIAGLCVAARAQSYVQAALASIDQPGPCAVIGHDICLGVEGAAFVNGTAAHGEDFDDTYEGGPVHAGAVIVPAVVAAAQLYFGTVRLLSFSRCYGVSDLGLRLCAGRPLGLFSASTNSFP